MAAPRPVLESLDAMLEAVPISVRSNRATMRRMAAYQLTAEPPKYYARLKWQAPTAALGFIAAALASNKVHPSWRDRFPMGPDVPRAALIVCVVGAIVAVVLFLAIWKTLRRRHQFWLRITPSEVTVHRPPLKDMTLEPREIIGFEDRKKALVLRTQSLTRNIIIPSELEGYAGCRAELVAMGISPIPRRHWGMRPALLLVAVAFMALAFYLSASQVLAMLGLATMVGFLLLNAYQTAGVTYLRVTPLMYWLWNTVLAMFLLNTYLLRFSHNIANRRLVTIAMLAVACLSCFVAAYHWWRERQRPSA